MAPRAASAEGPKRAQGLTEARASSTGSGGPGGPSHVPTYHLAEIFPATPHPVPSNTLSPATSHCSWDPGVAPLPRGMQSLPPPPPHALWGLLRRRFSICLFGGKASPPHEVPGQHSLAAHARPPPPEASPAASSQEASPCPTSPQLAESQRRHSGTLALPEPQLGGWGLWSGMWCLELWAGRRHPLAELPPGTGQRLSISCS